MRKLILINIRYDGTLTVCRALLLLLCWGSVLQGQPYVADWDLCSDIRMFYSVRTLNAAAPLLGLTAASAHNGLDVDIRNVYQSRLRGPAGDRFSAWCKLPGEGRILIPAALLTASLQWALHPDNKLHAVSRWGQLVTRAYMVGAPPLLTAQRLTGASRPRETTHAAQWRPLQDANGVSGHAFMGAVPFLALAEMTRNVSWIYPVCVAASVMPAWSRVHDDKHYFSQAVLGWLLAQQAVTAVTGRIKKESELSVVPYDGRWSINLTVSW